MSYLLMCIFTIRQYDVFRCIHK